MRGRATGSSLRLPRRLMGATTLSFRVFVDSFEDPFYLVEQGQPSRRRICLLGFSPEPSLA